MDISASKFVAKNPVKIDGTALPTDKMFTDYEELQIKLGKAGTPYAKQLAQRAFLG